MSDVEVERQLDENVEHNDEDDENERDIDVIDVQQYVNEQSESTQYRNIKRKVRSLSSALENIQRMNVFEQAKIYRSIQNKSPGQLEAIAMADVDTINEGKLLHGLIGQLKSYRLGLKDERDLFCSLLWGACGDDLLDDQFIHWLAKKLGKDKRKLSKIILVWHNVTTEPLEKRGRKKLSSEKQKAVFDAWHTYSIVTVDRRSGRDQVVMKNDQYANKFGSLPIPEDIVIEQFTSKRNQVMVRSTRRIATKTFHELKDLIKSKNNYDVSLGTIQNLKPFYVQTATEREKECCLCKFCLNCRLKYKEMIKHLKKDVEKTDSLSEYFGHGIVCPKGPNGYFQDKCQ